MQRSRSGVRSSNDKESQYPERMVESKQVSNSTKQEASCHPDHAHTQVLLDLFVVTVVTRPEDGSLGGLGDSLRGILCRTDIEKTF